MDGSAPVTDFDYPSLSKLKHFIKRSTNYELQGRACLKVLEGLVIGLFNISNIGFTAVEETLLGLKIGGPFVS